MATNRVITASNAVNKDGTLCMCFFLFMLVVFGWKQLV